MWKLFASVTAVVPFAGVSAVHAHGNETKTREPREQCHLASRWYREPKLEFAPQLQRHISGLAERQPDLHVTSAVEAKARLCEHSLCSMCARLKRGEEKD